MWTRRLASWALPLTVLLASTAGLARHDHNADVDRGGYDCAVDHERHYDAGGPAGPARSTPELRAGGEQHRHLCLGCHYNGHRFQRISHLPTAGPTPKAGASYEIGPPSRVSRSRANQTLRGPPSA